MIRSRVTTTVLSILVLVLSIGVTAASGAAGAPAAGAATTPAPSCTFNGSHLPIVTGQKAGDTVAIQCTGMGVLHPYLVMETSLLLAIDPAAAPLLKGQIVSLSGLLSLLDSLPEINPLALTFPISDLSGNMTVDYTLPSTQALDPNATCPPSMHQINAGLIGCGLAMIDLTTFKPVGAGSGLIEYAGDPLLPPDPTLVLSKSTAAPGAVVGVSDAPGTTTYWWLATLSALTALLGGGTPAPPTIAVTIHRTFAQGSTVANTVQVAPAVYNPPTLTPPKLSGSFVVHTKGHGNRLVTVTYQAQLDGLPLSISASAPLHVT